MPPDDAYYLWNVLLRHDRTVPHDLQRLAWDIHGADDNYCGASIREALGSLPNRPADLLEPQRAAPDWDEQRVSTGVRTQLLEHRALVAEPSEIPAILDEIRAEAMSSRATASLLANPHLDPELRHHVLDDIDTGALSIPAVFDLVANFPDDAHAVAVACRRYARRTLASHGWEPFGGSAMAVELIKHWAKAPRVSGAVDDAIAHALTMRHDLIAHLPLPAFRARMHDQRFFGAGAQAHLARLAADALGTDVTAWRLFEHQVGVGNGDMTIADALELCRAARHH